MRTFYTIIVHSCTFLDYICIHINSYKYITKKMIIPKLKISSWKALKEQGDIEKIAEASGKHRLTVSNAFSKGRASEELINSIDAFYKQRKKELA